jgi:hypothetical protein
VCNVAYERAIWSADQTRKGRASHFGRALLAADRKGSWRTRSTKDMDVEIIVALPHPDGSVSPMVIGAGSHEGFAKAWEEGEELGRNADDGLDPEQVRTTHIFKSMAEAGGVVSQAAFYVGVKMGSRMELGRSEPPDPSSTNL